MKTLDEVEPRTPISSLPLTITESGSYYLTGNLTTNSYGIRVDAPDVTIDMMGFSITGSTPDGFAGIEVSPVGGNNAACTIRDGVVRRFEFGVAAFDGTDELAGCSVIGVGAVEIGGYGIDIRSRNTLVRDCYAERSATTTVSFQSYGVVVTGGVIENCRASGLDVGLAAVNGLIDSSYAEECDTGALVLGGMARGCVLLNNTTQNLQLLGNAIGIDNYAP